MPKCKNCHKELSIDDKDLCPHCGQYHPFDKNDENDQTQFIDNVSGLGESKIYKRKSFKVYSLLFIFGGMFGLHYFYVKKYKQAITLILIDALFIVGLSLLLNYFFKFGTERYYLGWLIAIGACFIIYVILGLIAMVRHKSLDGEGQVIN